MKARRRAAGLALLATLGAGAPAAECAAADLQPLGVGTVWVYDYRAVMRFYCPGVGQARSVVRGTREGTTTDVEMSLVSFSAAGGPH